MNKPNPFETQTSAAEQLKKSRARLRFAVFGAITVGAIILVPLLVQGCKREEAPPAPVEDTNTTTALDTNGLPPFEPVHTNVLSLPAINFPPLTTNVPVVSAIAPTASGSEYTVAKGDSFYTIGKKFGVSTKAISDANPGVDSKKLKLGQKLNVPASTAAPTASANSIAPIESAATEATYTVKSGDTLLRIAKAHHMTVKAVKSANSLTTDRIKVGQKLKLPVKEAAAPTPVLEPTPLVLPPTTPSTLPTLPTPNK
jgi:LysM repeat protein